MAVLHSGTVLVDSLFKYCRAKRLWASAVWEMLHWTDPKYHQILAILRRYLGNPSLESRLDAITAIAQAAQATAQNTVGQAV
jgi:hypothetical protein